MKPKSFWKRPEGVTGIITLAMVLVGGGYLLYTFLPYLISLMQNAISAVLLFMVLGAIVYILLDPRFRNLIWFIYRSIMRTITSIFIQIDPIGILNTYIESLEKNLSKMGSQIGKLRGQMRKLKDIIDGNEKERTNSLAMASKAKEKGKQNILILKTRKAGRLQESNLKLSDLYGKMEILYRILSKMYENSEVLLEDIKDQVAVKKMEREAIRTSHSAMRSAMNIISGDKDKRMMFDQAMEAIADDVSKKVGEMERFMELSENFLDGVDLQNGVYEEKGLEMLEKWEKEGLSLILGEEKNLLLTQGKSGIPPIDIEQPLPKGKKSDTNPYNSLFE